MTGNQARNCDGISSESDGGESHGAPDVPALMDRIRSQVRQTLQAEPEARRPFKPFVADGEGAGDVKAGQLLYSEDLRFLNAHHAAGISLNPNSVASHRKGLVGRLVVKAKQKVRSIVWDLLKDYIAGERHFQGHLIRYLNDVSKYVDARDAANFWELIRKIDVDVAKCLERVERIQDDMRAEVNRFHAQLSSVDWERLFASIEDVARQRQSLETLDNVVRGLEGIIARLPTAGNPVPEAAVAPASAEGNNEQGYAYLLLENRFRGTEEEIAGRVSRYLRYFPSSDLPILEIGPGRAEFLSLCRDSGINCYGVDVDPAMVHVAHSKGLNAQHGDGIAHLRTLPDNSLSGLLAVQVVEHLPRQVLEELCRLAAAKVVPGGKVIFETINPQSLLALSSNYFRDPTHVWPLHPDTLQYTMELSGLTQCCVTYLSPVPQESQLQPLPQFTFLSPKSTVVVERLNSMIGQLNRLLYGSQDFCIVAEAPR
jgi:hypothetical protein